MIDSQKLNNTDMAPLRRIFPAFLPLIFLLQGCELTSYRPLGFHGGYSSSHLGGATYRIYVQGTYTSDYEVIKGYFHRRGAELCRKYKTTNYEVIALSERPCRWCLMVKPEIVGTIQCLESEGGTKTGRELVSNSQMNSYFSLLANQLMQDTPMDRTFRMAVFPLLSTQDNEAGELGVYCSNKLSAVLFGFKNVQMVERQQLDQVVEELALTLSGRFDETTIKSIGQFLGVDYIVVGSYTVPRRVEADVTARVVEVKTGEILGVGSIQIPRVWIEGLISS